MAVKDGRVNGAKTARSSGESVIMPLSVTRVEKQKQHPMRSGICVIAGVGL